MRGSQDSGVPTESTNGKEKENGLLLIEQNLGLFSKSTFLLEIYIRALGHFWFFSTQFIVTFRALLSYLV